MGQRKRYSAQFKRETVELATREGVSAAQVARDLGLNPNMVNRWVREHRDGVGAAFPGQGKARDAELAELRRELGRVKRERDFLREAATFFAKASK